MSNTLTKEILVDAIQKSKATTISGVWKYLGHKSAISGSQGKRIRGLVPNHLELLEANKNGTLVKAEKTQVKAEETQVKAVTQVPKTHTPKKGKGPGGFRAGSNYAVLFEEGNKGYATRDELITRVAKITGKEERLVKFGLKTVMQYPNHKSNNGRARIDEYAGKIRILPAN